MSEAGGDETGRIKLAYNIVLGRDPKPREATVLNRALGQFRAQFAGKREGAVKFLAQGDSVREERFPPEELAAYASLASLVLNLDEAVTKE